MAQRGEYIRAVETLFLSYGGGGFVLSAQDEAVVDDWFTRQIPLNSLLRGLDSACRENSTRQRPGRRNKPLTFFAKRVEELTESSSEWQAPSAPLPADDPKPALGQRLAAGLIPLMENDALAAVKSSVRNLQHRLVAMTDGAVWRDLALAEAELDTILQGAVSDADLSILAEQAQGEALRQCGALAAPAVVSDRRALLVARAVRVRFGCVGLATMVSE